MKRRTSFVIAGAASAAIVASATLLAFAAVGEGSGEVRIGTPNLSVLDRPAANRDALPREVAGSPFARQFADVSAARLVLTSGETRLFVVPGQNGFVCLIEYKGAAGHAGNCAEREKLVTEGIWLSEWHPDGTFDIVGVVGDGHRYVEVGGTRAAVANNAFALSNVTGEELVLGGAAGERIVRLGPQAPRPTRP